ncbi:MAG: hypothetical protein AAGD34_15565 [Pseudomonadota bacterium]
MRALIPLLALVLPTAVVAETTLIDTGVLPSSVVHEVATLTPLAVTPSGAPAVLLLDLEAGDVVPPHAAPAGLRLLTVLSGEMSWGDGSRIDETQETVYPAGSILTLPAGVDHWLAARNGSVRLQLILLDDETPVPAMAQQMTAASDQ